MRKSCYQLKARLERLGYNIICKSGLPDYMILYMASRKGCVVVTSDKRMRLQARANGLDVVIIYVEPYIVERKSARDLATRIIKLVMTGAGAELVMNTLATEL